MVRGNARSSIPLRSDRSGLGSQGPGEAPAGAPGPQATRRRVLQSNNRDRLWKGEEAPSAGFLKGIEAQVQQILDQPRGA